jgi:hypothetical protein
MPTTMVSQPVSPAARLLIALLVLAGVLSVNELCQGLADSGLTDDEIEQWMFKLDADGDGKVQR